MNKVYLDLFSGIGGFAKGLENSRFKFDKHYFSEIDKHAIAVYKHHFKNAEHVGDIKSISRQTITERPNIITFGFPCQDLSIAGKGVGINGSRSSLFFEAIRLIKEFKPEIFIFENVKGLLSSNEGKDFEVVLRTIADIGLYECEWQLVNTSWLLPQNRERIYFIGHLRGKGKPRVFPIRKSDSVFAKRIRKREGSGQPCTTITKNYHKGVHNQGETYVVQKTGGYCTTIKQDITGTLQAGGSNVMDKIPNVVIKQKSRGFNKGGKKEIYPTISSNSFEHNNHVVISHYGHKDKSPQEHNICPTLKAESHGHKPMIKQINKSKESGGKQPFQQNRVYDTDGILPALSSELSGRNNIEVKPILTPNRKEKRQDGLRFKENGEPAFTLNTQDQHGVQINNQIRRLTEIECERLQGFEDGWTQFGNYDGTVKKVSKTQRYKMLGNAVTVDIVELIAKRLI